MRLWREDQKISHKGIMMVAVPLALNLLSLAALAYLLNQQELETEREANAKSFHLLASQLGRTFLDAGVTISFCAMRNDPAIGEKHENAKTNINNTFKQLVVLEKDDPSQLKIL